MPKPIETAKDAVRGAMRFARLIGGRDVVLSSEGITVVDGMGRSHALTRDGIPYKPDLKAFVEEFRLANRYFKPAEDLSDLDVTEEIGDLGEWNFSKKEDAFRLRAKKPSPTCIDGIFKHEPEDLARMRSLYGQDGIDVIVVTEGAPRSREIALGLVAERRLVGLPTKLDMKAEQRRYGFYRDDSDFQGAETFDAPPGDAPEWDVLHLSRHDLVKAMLSEDAPATSRILVGEAQHYGADYAKHVMAQGRPTILIDVRLQKSVPTARIVINDAAMTLSSSDPGIPDAPWVRHAEKASKRSSKPAAPKTWHQTTAAVAEAFIARRAPRGYVSSKSLFFHGPVAYSIWDDNPIAAFVKGPDGKPFLLIGRDRTLGGGKSAIVTMAIQDIRDACGIHNLPEMQMLETILRIGDQKLQNFARGGRNDKNETAFPDMCHFDRDGLSEWILSEHEHLLAEIRDAHFTGVTYPTHKQAMARSKLADLAELRDRMAHDYGLDLPEVGDAIQLRAEARAARNAVAARNVELQARRNAAETQDEPTEAPTP